MAASGSTTSVEELARATLAAVAGAPAGRQAEALAAWIFAWHHHWPDGFRHAFGEGNELLAWATMQVADTGRYLKLRRIAIENLAQVL